MPPAQDRNNTVWHAFDGVFYFAAITVVSLDVVVPAMVTDLTDSALAVGLIQPILWLGLFAPQIFHAKHVEGLAYKKNRVALCALLQRIGWPLFLASLFIYWGSPVTLVAFFACFAINSFGSGMIIPVWTDWYAKTTPEGDWGKVLGIRRAASGLLGILLGIFYIRPVMDEFAPPGRYQILVGTGVLFFAVSLFSVWMVQEEPDHGLPNQRDTSWADYLRDLAGILKRRRDFRRFMGALMVSWLPLLLMASFLAKYGLTYAGVQKGVAGTYTVFRSASLGAGAFVAGLLTDRMGMLTPFRMVPLVLLGAATTAAISPHPAAVSVAFVLFGFAFGIRMVVVLPAVFRYAGPHRRPSYMALSFTLLGLTSIAAPPLAGWLLDAGVLTFRMLFIGCGMLSIAGFLLFLQVAEPETEQEPTPAL